jgi:acylphosphatase
MAKARAHVFVSGLVQGVFFRAETRDLARQLGVTGWVRNLWDGRVEAVIEGEDWAVQRLTTWCGRGPRGARVDSVQITHEDYRGEYDTFTVRY